MDKAVFAMCALTALSCAVLLLRAYFRSRFRLLLWSGLCFAGLTVNNALLVIDRAVLPTEVDLSTWRLVLALVAVLLLVVGLVLESDR